MPEGDFRHHATRYTALRLRHRIAMLATGVGLVAVGFQVLPVVAWAGRPLTVDDAAPVAPGRCEIEFGARGVFDSAIDHYDLPIGLALGVAPTLEVGLGFGGQIENREEDVGRYEVESGFGDLGLGAKWNPLPEEKFWASHALSLGLKLPTASREHDFGSGRADCDLTYIASKTLATNWNAHFNAGCTWVGDPADEDLADIFHTGVALGWAATERVEWVAACYANVPVRSSSDATMFLDGGLRWTARANLIFDGAVGGKLRGAGPDWTITVGLTWTFELIPSRKRP